MSNILVLGAGLSASYLIKYLLDNASTYHWHITVVDSNIELAKQKINGHTNGNAIACNIANDKQRFELISNHDIVVSLVPPALHILAAKDCILLRKHLVTASYITNEMRALDAEATTAGVLLLNECGLDPGIDHLSAMRLIDEMKSNGFAITSFKSFCGGLVAPTFDDNPWNYKFTWNPRNVVVAGQATAKYLENNTIKFITPSHIFDQTESISVNGYGAFESYANRDSLAYIEPYGIQTAHTVLRGTLRKKGFCEAWNLLVKIGLTDDTFIIRNTSTLTMRSLVNSFVPGTDLAKVESRVCQFLKIREDSFLFQQLKWLGLFEDTSITLTDATPAQILQQLLQQKWKLKQGELDMIVMKHIMQFEGMVEGQKATIETESELVVLGENDTLTAMAKTVGLPLAIAVKNILLGNIKSRGVQLPTTAEFYEPILQELTLFCSSFIERKHKIA